MTCPHCQTPISEHPANRCLDAWIHVDIFGYKLPDHNWQTDTHCDCIRDYSTSIKDAWEVAEKYGAWRLHKREWGDLYWIDLYITEGQQNRWADSVDAFTAPLAICRAAIKAATEGTPEH